MQQTPQENVFREISVMVSESKVSGDETATHWFKRKVAFICAAWKHPVQGVVMGIVACWWWPSLFLLAFLPVVF